MKLHQLRLKADTYAANNNIEAFAKCLKQYIGGLNGERQTPISTKQLDKVFSNLPSVVEDFYQEAIWLLIDDDEIGYGRNSLAPARHNSSYKYWIH